MAEGGGGRGGHLCAGPLTGPLEIPEYNPLSSKKKIQMNCLIEIGAGFDITKRGNKPFPSSTGPLFQNEGRCSAFDMKIIFHSHANKTHFHKRGCAPILGDPGAVSRVDVKVCCLLASI